MTRTNPKYTLALGSGSPQARFENISGPTVPRASANLLAIGSTVGSYQIVEQIGCGSMGMVYQAVHPHLGRSVAIKVLHAALLEHDGIDTRMLQEASILEGLQHPGVTKIFDCGVLEDRRVWIAMELIAGESLGSKLSRVGTLPPIEVCNLIAAIADVLATAHLHRIVHRDLKPENVLFADADSGFPLRLIDWGIARVGPVARLTLDGVTCGTPTYMSPEQLRARDIAPPCDIYSLGVIAYEAICGVPPYDGPTRVAIAARHLDGDATPLSELAPTTSRALCDLVHAMISTLPGDRPTAAEARQTAQCLALEISSCEFEISEQPPVTMSIRRPRWTPELSYSIAGEIHCLADSITSRT